MRRIWICFWAGLLAVSGAVSPVSAELSAEDVTKNMQRQLDGVKSLSADFILTSYLDALEQSSETTGRILLLKNHNKLRLEQDGQTIVSDGESVWTYVPENQQIIVSPAEHNGGGMRPDDFLFYYTGHYTPTLVGKEVIDGVMHYIMKLTANDDTADLEELKIWVDDQQWLTQKVVYFDDTGSSTTIRFSSIRLNPPLSDDTFVMQIPEGVEVVDLR